MEGGRARKQGPAVSPERAKVWTEPPAAVRQHCYQLLQQQPMKRVPVVYYLCRNHQLEHPHFVEVPLSSPQGGLYLRDVIDRLNAMRGKGMAARYSWSCKRSYKNGFVWQDLSEFDLISPAHGNEYILKGSELLDPSPPPDRGGGVRVTSTSATSTIAKPTVSYRIQEPCSSSSSPKTEIKEAPLLPLPPRSPPSQEDDSSPHRHLCSSGNVSPEPGAVPHSSWQTSSHGSGEYRIYKVNGAVDASTQTDDINEKNIRPKEIRTRGVSTEEGSCDAGYGEDHPNRMTGYKEDEHEIVVADTPPAPESSSSSSLGKMGTLGSLIRAEASKMNSFRILEEETVFLPTKAKMKAVDMLMQLITCGAMSVKGHHSFGLIPTYKPVFSHVNFPSPMYTTSMRTEEIDCLTDNPRLMRLGIEEKEYFSGSLIETKKQKDKAAKGLPTLKRSSSYEERMRNSSDKTADKETIVDSLHSKCLPRSIKITSSKQSKHASMPSPLSDAQRNSSAWQEYSPSSTLHSSNGGSKRMSDKGSSMRLESFKDESERVYKIEERLTSGARVIIQSTSASETDR